MLEDVNYRIIQLSLHPIVSFPIVNRNPDLLVANALLKSDTLSIKSNAMK
jgi:hypothetical protein